MRITQRRACGPKTLTADATSVWLKTINLTVTMYGRIVTALTRLPIEIAASFVADMTRFLDAVVPFPIQKDADQAA